MPNPTFVPLLRQGADVSFATVAVTGVATVGGTLTITGVTALNGGGTYTGLLAGTGATGTTVLQSGIATGDSFDRWRMDASGRLDLGPGNGARDTTLRRSAVGVLATDGSFSLATAGGGLLVKEGVNATMGAATLAGGTVTVNTTKVTATSRILLTVQSLGTVTAPKAIGVTARTAATGFTITSADPTDTSVIGWTIFEPAP